GPRPLPSVYPAASSRSAARVPLTTPAPSPHDLIGHEPPPATERWSSPPDRCSKAERAATRCSTSHRPSREESRFHDSAHRLDGGADPQDEPRTARDRPATRGPPGGPHAVRRHGHGP